MKTESPKINSIVTVTDTSNYKSSYAEKVPFKAKVIYNYGQKIIVQSFSGKIYELYQYQIENNGDQDN